MRYHPSLDHLLAAVEHARSGNASKAVRHLHLAAQDPELDDMLDEVNDEQEQNKEQPAPAGQQQMSRALARLIEADADMDEGEGDDEDDDSSQSQQQQQRPELSRLQRNRKGRF